MTGDLVPEGSDCACPNCGERDIDKLVWREDCSGIDCQTCGTFYDPNRFACDEPAVVLGEMPEPYTALGNDSPPF